MITKALPVLADEAFEPSYKLELADSPYGGLETARKCVTLP